MAAGIDKKRLGWMDILRGLLIITIVMSHASGLQNEYLYQFHVSTFFFVSGYMTKQERRGVVKTVYHRFLTLYVPVFVVLAVMLLGMSALAHLGYYELFFGNQVFFGFTYGIKQFILRSWICAWWLGAAWFCIVLFLTTVLCRVLFRLCREQYGWCYLLLSGLLFLAGYYFTARWTLDWRFDLVLIAQFYFVLGTMAGHKGLLDSLTAKTAVCAAGVVVTAVMMFVIGRWLHWAVDYASGHFNTPPADVFAAMNGMLLLFFASVLLEKIPFVSGVLQYLGKNTMAIMLFHFMGFKPVYFALYALGLCALGDIGSNTVPMELWAYWPLFVTVGVAVSVLVWEVLMKVYPLRVLLGQERKLYDKLYDKAAGLLK